MKRSKILVSAYAFNPLASLQLHPGEDIVGWKLVEQISQFHDVWVITHSYNQEGVLEALSRGAMPGVNIHFLELPKWMWRLYKLEFGQRIYYYLWQIAAWRKAKKLHQQIEFDLTHHLTFGNDWIPSFIGAFLPVPFIWGPVGGGQKTPHCLRKEYTIYGRFAELSRRIAQWFGRHLWSRRRCVRNARSILVCNRETRKKIPTKYSQKVRFFPVNGVDEKDIRSTKVVRKKRKTFRIIAAGRLHRLKGFALAIKAFNAAFKEMPESEFLIVGKGPEQKNLQDLINDLKVGKRVKIHDWMDREDLLKKMKASDVFLFPSFRDGGGAVVVEAMACGLPVICLDTAGPGFHIRKEWGIKVEPRSPDFVITSMAAALKKLYKKDALRVKLGEAARKQAKQFYVWQELGNRLQEIYTESLNSQKK